MATLAENQHVSIHLLPQRAQLLQLSTENVEPNLLETDIQVLIPVLWRKNTNEKKTSKVFDKRKSTQFNSSDR